MTVHIPGAILRRLGLDPHRAVRAKFWIPEYIMRLEYGFELAECEVPRFAVEAVEGIGKLFTLATLILNVLAVKDRVEIVFHGLNPEDPERKIRAFENIASSTPTGPQLVYSSGNSGAIPGSSSYFQWLTVSKAS